MEEHVSEYEDVRREEVEEEKADDDDEEEGDIMSFATDSDELSKRADDFIARVNERMKLELNLLQRSSYLE